MSGRAACWSASSVAPCRRLRMLEAVVPATAIRPAGVLGCGTALPPDAVSTAAIAERLGLAEDWIVSRTGVRSRRIAAPDARLADLSAEGGPGGGGGRRRPRRRPPPPPPRGGAR